MSLFSCDRPIGVQAPLTQPALTERGVNVVVEIPAGTNHKIEIDKETGQFENDRVDGEIRIIDFLPYPGNYGFIPSTYMDLARGGDGDALDILVLSESVPTGSLIESRPIGAMRFLDGGEIDTKIVAVPVDSSLQIIQVDNLLDFMLEYDGARRILEDWFLYYKGYGAMEFLEWKDEHYAMEEVRKWMVE